MTNNSIPEEILEKANTIIFKAKRDYMFLVDNAKLMSMQEREVDGAYYEAALGDNYILEIKTEDFSIIDYEIVEKDK